MEFTTQQYLQPDTALQDRTNQGNRSLLNTLLFSTNVWTPQIEVTEHTLQSCLVKYLQIWHINISYENNGIWKVFEGSSFV